MSQNNAPKERPILFSGPMVRAILDGSKTQTRRVMKPQPPFDYLTDANGHRYGCVNGTGEAPCKIWSDTPWRISYQQYDKQIDCPYGQPGDILWVRETWRPKAWSADGEWGEIEYQAGANVRLINGVNWSFGKAYPLDKDVSAWRPSIHMPRWASRMLLDVVSVRVERLNEISEKDAEAEGITEDDFFRKWKVPDRRSAFQQLWDCINGERADWASNPWIWVVTFKRSEVTP